MKLIRILPLLLILGIVMQPSCDEVSDCESHDHPLPEISLLHPQDSVIVWPYQGPAPEVTLLLKADAGLNTLSMDQVNGYRRGIHVFTGGETQVQYAFPLDYVYDGRIDFIIHDLCNQRAVAQTRIVFEQPPSR